MDYMLYYWEAPFRGNFPRMILWESKSSFKERDPTDIYPGKRLQIEYPGMAPPYLFDHSKGYYLAQMPAIMMYLAEKLNYLPNDKFSRHLSAKLILDCNDVLHEITQYNGTKMWEKKSWNEFRHERLATWISIFEKTGRDHGLEASSRFMFGNSATVADFALTALFGTMIHCLPPLRGDLQEYGPRILGLCQRMEKRPNIKACLEEQREQWGELYCGGQIERSIRKMLK